MSNQTSLELLKGKIVIAKDKLESYNRNLAKLEASGVDDDSIMSTFKSNIESVTLEISALESQIKSAEKLEKLQTFDWSKHANPLIRLAWNETKLIHDTKKFSRKKVTKTLVNALRSSDIDRVAILLPGPTGSGKSTAVRWASAEINRPSISQNFSGNMEETDVIGGPTIDPEGKVIMKDGPLTEAVRNGLVYIAEEMNFAKPQVTAILNSLLDGAQQIILPSGEIVKAAPGFKFVGTINPNYSGTRSFNRALINRFGTVIWFDRPSNHKLEQIVKSVTGYGKTKDELLNLRRLLVYTTAVEEIIKREDFDASISIRQVIAATRFLQDGETFKNAVLYGIVHQVGNFDEELEVKMTTIAEKVHSSSAEDLKINVKLEEV